MKSITPSRVSGSVPAPPSKSMTVRALAAGLLARGTSTLRNVSHCDDGVAATEVIERLGTIVERQGEVFMVHGTALDPTALQSDYFNCGESGLAMRMFAPVVALLDRTVILTASGSLASRPMEMIRSLEQLGVTVTMKNLHPPLSIRGPMKAGHITTDASVSSQFLTGLLTALPLCSGDSIISARSVKSGPYVRMTIHLLDRFGISIRHDDRLEEFSVAGGQSYRPTDYIIEGDWSGAAFLLVAGATSGDVTVTGLDPKSYQADRAIIRALEDAGARVTMDDESVTVEQRDLRSFEFDATDCPDLFPPLVVLAARCDGTTVIHGAHRLAHKESDRAGALRTEFERLGVTVNLQGDRLEVVGGRIGSGAVDSHNDHRIAMAAAVAGLGADGPVVITRDEAVFKSYPGFFSDLNRLQVKG
jgi:3-phosphoshikimate 1-carboxyvinyltransferase